MGDKTQIATAALAARFHSILAVTVGSTAGLLLTSAPALVLGRSVGRLAPFRLLRVGGALVYLALGLWSFAEALGWIG
jgi:putative Ca2+/H+ antiporter (TMEM165/GDT1 family)